MDGVAGNGGVSEGDGERDGLAEAVRGPCESDGCDGAGGAGDGEGVAGWGSGGGRRVRAKDGKVDGLFGCWGRNMVVVGGGGGRETAWKGGGWREEGRGRSVGGIASTGKELVDVGEEAGEG